MSPKSNLSIRQVVGIADHWHGDIFRAQGCAGAWVAVEVSQLLHLRDLGVQFSIALGEIHEAGQTVWAFHSSGTRSHRRR